MIKRKGQVIPRNLVKVKNRRGQHKMVFGCDVEIYGKTVTAISNGHFFEILDDKFTSRGRKMRTGGIEITGLNLVGFGGDVLKF